MLSVCKELNHTSFVKCSAFCSSSQAPSGSYLSLGTVKRGNPVSASGVGGNVSLVAVDSDLGFGAKNSYVQPSPCSGPGRGLVIEAISHLFFFFKC